MAVFYGALLLFSASASTLHALTDTETAEIKQRIKTNTFCKSFLHGICCADDPGIFSSSSSLLSPDTVTPHPSKEMMKFSKVAIFQGLNIEYIHQVTSILQGQNIETLKIVGSSRLSVISNSASHFSSSLKILDLSNNSITFESHPEIHAFHYSQNLIELNLSHNNISSTGILMEALKPLKNLKRLYLNNNRKLNFEHGETFPASLGQLEFLDLSYCHIWNFNDNVFNHLTNLKVLHLEGNTLSSIPASLCSRPSSMQIYLAKTHIDASYQKHLEEKCTVKISFELPLSNDKEFKIVESDLRLWIGWFNLFVFCLFFSFCLAVYILYMKYGNVFYQKIIPIE